MDVPDNGLPEIRSQLMQLILTSGLEIDQCKPILARKKTSIDDAYAATLSQAIINHNHSYALEIAESGTLDFTQKFVKSMTGLQLDFRDLPQCREFGRLPLHITITEKCPTETGDAFREALSRIR